VVYEVAFAVLAQELELNLARCWRPLEVEQGAWLNLRPPLAALHRPLNGLVVVAS
jgi:hypothetical protein